MSNTPDKYEYYQGESIDDVLDYANARTQNFRIVSVFPVLTRSTHPLLSFDTIFVVVLERLPPPQRKQSPSQRAAP